jgi:hypothetical protein
MITRNNCEAWFLDYYEGNLSEEGTAQLFAFLEANPDMRELFDSFDDLNFNPENEIRFDGKDLLKKESNRSNEINESNYEEWMISFIEGNLNEADETKFNEWLTENPSKEKELELFRATILNADINEVFDAKETIKKEITLDYNFFEAWAVAYLEGELTEKDKTSFEKFLAENPSLQKEYDQFTSAKLKADSSIVFDYKEGLKKKAVISSQNFDEYAIAFTEEILDRDQKILFKEFIAANPTFRKQLDLFTASKLTADSSILFENKAALHRKPFVVTNENAEELILSSFEGLLNKDEEQTLEVYLKANPEKQSLVTLFAKTKLQADTAIVFEDKAGLKRRSAAAFWSGRNIRFAAAAAIALLVGIFWFNNDKTSDAQLATILNNRNNFVHQRPEKKNEQNDLVQPENQPVRNPTVNYASNNTQNTNQNIHSNTSPKEAFASINTKRITKPIESQTEYRDVVYSDTYHNSITSAVATSPDQPAPQSFVQFAMHRIKKELDKPMYETMEPDDMAEIQQEEANKDITGFDLTKSAVNRIGHATNSNLRLIKDEKGTMLTIWKYDLYLNKN